MRTMAAISNNSETASSSQRSADITQEQEYFLYELETSDASTIGLVLRAIYDGGDVHKFMRALEKKIRHYDRDIERLCSVHYQGFIDAIRELLQVKQQCRQLKENIEVIDGHLQDSSQTLITKGQEIIKYRRMQKNIAAAIDVVTICLPMLEKYSKLTDQMQQKRYYPALKTLELLEHTYFPRVAKFRFAQELIRHVESIREEIKDASFSEFKDFLENIRKVSSRVGEVALRHASELHDLDPMPAIRKRERRLALPVLDTSHHIAPSSPEKMLGGPVLDDEDEFSAQDIVDFSAVYRCCHIFTVLGAKDVFENYYRKQRTEQAGLVLKPPDNLKQTLEDYLKYFYECIGFFVIEDHVMHTAPGLVTRAYRDALWEMASKEVTSTLNKHFAKCVDADVMLRIKKLVLLFSLAMKGYGFQVQTLYKVLQSFRDLYNEILMSKCCERFENILGTDNYTPMTVDDEEEYLAVTNRFPCHNRALEMEPFPKRFPFSAFVPDIYDQVKAYIKGCFRFTEGLGLSQTEVDDTVRRYTNVLLERLSGSLKGYIANRRLTLVQLVQITINMGYLEKSCEALEQTIMQLIGISQSNAHVVKLKQGAHMFTDARSEVEHQIYQALNLKISEFLELANYDWDLSESSGRASEYIMDLNAFLLSTFLSFTNLPVSLARAACMSACKHVANGLMQFLIDPETKYITMGALEQFNLDVIQCEQFAAQCPVPGFEDGTLLLTFAEMRQLLDLFMSSDWSGYLADFGKERSQYVRVNPQTATLLLEKLIEADRRKNSLFSRNKDKDKKKLLETILRQLRNLSSGAA